MWTGTDSVTGGGVWEVKYPYHAACTPPWHYLFPPFTHRVFWIWGF